jgi:pimeloyl-ACP methyl ester carboxylesterase
MKKPCLVMIPALACDSRLYAQVAKALAEVATIQSPVIVKPTLAQGVAAILEDAPKAFVVAGTSYGGRLAIETALVAPERVLALWVMGASPSKPSDKEALIARSDALRSGKATEVIIQMADKIVSPAGSEAAVARQQFLDMANAMSPLNIAIQNDALVGREDLWPEIERLNCPSLWLWGEHDQFSSLADGRRAAELAKGGIFRSISNCGHLPSLESPHETAATGRDLLQRVIAWPLQG